MEKTNCKLGVNTGFAVAVVFATMVLTAYFVSYILLSDKTTWTPGAEARIYD